LSLTLSPVSDNVLDSPVNINDPIYGEMNPTFTDFIAPGMLIAIIFAQSIGLTALGLVMERKEGLISRIWAAGVVPADVIISLLMSQFFILAAQITLMLIFALLVFNIPMVGNLGWVLLLMFIMGFAGMMLGLIISTIARDEAEAVQLAVGSFFPVLLLSGVIWPLEGIPKGLNYVSYCLPTTWAAEAMRSILIRGWGMLAESVWMGFVVPLAWQAVFMFLAIVGLKRTE
jgi:ABC-type multidrug transport system permease subunit